MKAPRKNKVPAKKPRAKAAAKRPSHKAATDLHVHLSSLVASGGVRLVDLTQTLSPDFPPIRAAPRAGTVRVPSGWRQISRYDEGGPGLVLEQSKLRRTHRYALRRAHSLDCRDLPNNAARHITDCKFHRAGLRDRLQVRQASADADFVSYRRPHRGMGRRHGRIASGSWVLMRTDWSKRTDPVAFQNLDEIRQHTPGPDPDCVRFLVKERDVLASAPRRSVPMPARRPHFTPPYPCHYYMHGAGNGLQCLCNLDVLPPTGALVVAAPLKILEGSGSPLRVFALVPERARG